MENKNYVVRLDSRNRIALCCSTLTSVEMGTPSTLPQTSNTAFASFRVTQHTWHMHMAHGALACTIYPDTQTHEPPISHVPFQCSVCTLGTWRVRLEQLQPSTCLGVRKPGVRVMLRSPLSSPLSPYHQSLGATSAECTYAVMGSGSSRRCEPPASVAV